MRIWKPRGPQERKKTRPLLDENGNWYENHTYHEIGLLEEMLDNAGIPYEKERFMDGWLLSYPSVECCVASVAEHYASYGREYDLLELDGLVQRSEQITDWVLGWLNAKEVFRRIEAHWKEARHVEANQDH